MTAKNSKLDPAAPVAAKVAGWAGSGAERAARAAGCVMSASMKLSHSPDAVSSIRGEAGVSGQGMLPTLAALELACTVVYVVPRTAVLGAVLLTGYLGGAVATQ